MDLLQSRARICICNGTIDISVYHFANVAVTGGGTIAEEKEQGMTVLVIDDNDSVVQIAAQWLEESGYTVKCSCGFHDATRQLAGGAVDVAVIDVRLGEFNGLQLAIRARQQWPNMHLVVMSAWDDPVLKHEAAGVNAAYLVKPFTAEQLFQAVAPRRERTVIEINARLSRF